MAVWTPQPIGDQDNLQIFQWGPGVAFGDTCVPVARGDIVDRSIQVSGTFGSGTTVNIAGSNEATTNLNGTYVNLHDPFSNVISITSSGLIQVVEVTAWMKPVVSAGDGTESLTITICSRRSFK